MTDEVDNRFSKLLERVNIAGIRDRCELPATDTNGVHKIVHQVLAFAAAAISRDISWRVELKAAVFGAGAACAIGLLFCALLPGEENPVAMLICMFAAMPLVIPFVFDFIGKQTDILIGKKLMELDPDFISRLNDTLLVWRTAQLPRHLDLTWSLNPGLNQRDWFNLSEREKLAQLPHNFAYVIPHYEGAIWAAFSQPNANAGAEIMKNLGHLAEVDQAAAIFGETLKLVDKGRDALISRLARWDYGPVPLLKAGFKIKLFGACVSATVICSYLYQAVPA